MKAISRRLCLALVVLSVLVMSTRGQEAAAQWQLLASARKAIGNFRFQVKGDDPLELRVTRKTDGRAVNVMLYEDGIKAAEVIPGVGILPVPSSSVYPLPKGGDTREITLKFRENEWSVCVDGRLRAVLSARFLLPGDVSIATAQAGRVVGKPKFTAAARANYITNFMIEPGAPNELYPWNIQTGAWHLHTALQQAIIRPETNQRRTKEAPLTADKSPNFYSLKGGGKNVDCIITTGYEVYDNYSMTCSIQPVQGEAGIVIYHRDQEVPEGAKPDPAKAEFYALTMIMNPAGTPDGEIRLWQQKNGQRRVIQRAAVQLFKNQWYLPGIAAHGDEIVCSLDNCELFRVKEPLTIGGKFGMFANTPEEIRMDDVTVKPFADITLNTIGALRFNCLKSLGAVAVGGKSLAAAAPHARSVLCLGNGRGAAGVIMGREHHTNMVFSANVIPPQDGAWTLGLVAGWTGADAERLEFAVSRKAGGTAESYALNRVKADGTREILAESSLAAPWDGKAKADDEFELMVDATEPGILRCLKNGRLALFAEVPKTFPGAYGIWVDAGTAAIFRKFNLDLRRNVFKELQQKNTVFQHDSFMRHWASPEGQWIAGKANAMWHKGDFFGDYLLRLPCINGTDLSVAVPDDKDDGPVAVTVSGGTLKMAVNEWLAGAQPREYAAALTPPAGKSVDALDFTLFHEGQWLWISVDGKIVMKHCLTSPLRRYGTRARVRGLNTQQLARSKVTRSNVIDEFFNESPFMWTANGGDWQIINRFQCTPSWSHMIGEAYHTLGAFWRKQIFKGDMTLEFYAGSRQGESYSLIGNYNCTIMSKNASANSGYTATCAEWDQNESQNWSVLYKNGQMMTKTDKYLSPRTRRHNWRRITNPLVSHGRDVHGAWYYIKLRKIGDKLEYYFDDELVYTQQDSEPLQEGMVGIWTFLQSMTLAQIKITYDSVEPRPVPVTLLAPEAPAPRGAKAARPQLATRVNGWPVETMAAANWSVDDPVGQSVLTEFDTAAGTAEMLVNHLGAGDMTMRSKLPGLPGGTVAGWHFKAKRTDKALFNLFYEVTITGKDGKRQGRRSYFHRISGDDFSAGSWRKAGQTDLKPVAQVTDADGDWTDVTVWLPANAIGTTNEKRAVTLSLCGFGSEQQDSIRNGVQGNVPGSAYAIAALAPVAIGEPVIELASGETFQAFADAAGKSPIKAATIPELLAQLKAFQKIGLNSFRLDVAKDGRKVTQNVCWLVQRPVPDIAVEWDKNVPDGIRLTHRDAFPDSRFKAWRRLLACGGEIAMPVEDHVPGNASNVDTYVFRFPKTRAMMTAAAGGKLSMTLKLDDEKIPVELSLADAARCNRGPVLLKLNGFTPFFCGFENGLEAPLAEHHANSQYHLMTDGTTDSGNYLLRTNTGGGQRLRTPFVTNFSAANYPVAQFRYAASDMANVSLNMAHSDSAVIRLTSGDQSGTVAVRHGNVLVQDEAWHTWMGVVSDGFTQQNYYNPRRLGGSRAIIGSVNSPDQTGRFSWLKLDNMVFGPAVKAAEQLKFTPEFYDIDGVAAVQFAILPGESPWYDLPDAVKAALQWTKVAPGVPVVPVLDSVKDGLRHLVLKAVDGRGVESAPIDLPFLLDRAPLTVGHGFEDTTEPQSNGRRLAIKLSTHMLSPIRLDKATFRLGKDAKPAALDGWGSFYTHRAASDLLQLNYPYLLRDLLDAAKNGDTLDITMEGIEDGAGNTTPAYTIQCKVDYASDKTGPAWLSLDFPASYASAINWDGRQATSAVFSPGSNNRLNIVNAYGVSPYLENGTYYHNGSISMGLKWSIARHPYLAFRLNENEVNSKTHLQVELRLADKSTYTISLDKPGKAGNELNRSKTFARKTETWYRFLFDVQKMMRDIGIAQEKINGMTVNSIAFVRSGHSHNTSLRLDDFFIFGGADKTDAPDVLKWSAYDASGVASMEMTCVDDNDKELFKFSCANIHENDLNKVRDKFEGVNWFKVQTKDKAGNLSYPCWIPIFAPVKPKPAPAPATPVAPAAAKPAPAAPAAPAAAKPAPVAPAAPAAAKPAPVAPAAAK